MYSDITFLFVSKYLECQKMFFFLIRKKYFHFQNLTNWTAYLLSTSLPYDPYGRNPEDWMNLFKVKPRKFWKRRNINGYLPTLYMAVTVGTKGDTFIDTQGWGKGMMIANGHNLGRYEMSNECIIYNNIIYIV